MTMTVPTLLVHAKTSSLAATSVVAAGSSGEALAGTIGGAIGTFVAVTTLILAVASNNAKKRAAYADEISDAEKRGRDSRDEEVARLTQWMEFYRVAYANVLQAKAGAQVQPLPPQMTNPVPPAGPPPTPTPQLPPQTPPPPGGNR